MEQFYSRWALGGKRVITYIKAFTRRSVLDVLKSRKFLNPVTNLATVDARGYDYIQSLRGIIFIFGVGSSVVCSTGLGNARASGRGTDNKQFPRLSQN